MSHTKGPWFVSKQGYFVRYHIPGFANCNICDVDCGAPLEEREANAKLIAAAPELLEALQAIERGFADGSIKFTKKRQSDSDPYHPANTLMCDALAKVEGR